MSKERAPGTGYDLNTEFEGGAKYFWSVEYGEIYRALQTMQKEGWLACAPEDFAATIFHCLGIGPDREFHDSIGSPYPYMRNPGRCVTSVSKISQSLQVPHARLVECGGT